MNSPEVVKTVRCIGKDCRGDDVMGYYERGTHQLRVRFSGMVKPVNQFSVPVQVAVHRCTTGGWYVDSALVSPAFRFEGAWYWPFNACEPLGKRRMFASREVLETLLRDGGFVPVPGSFYEHA